MEMVQCARRMKKPIIVLKLDFQKAFDTVHWKALIHTMQKRGFPASFVRWVELLLSTSQVQMLVNGVAGDRFPIARGVRQGDPLSPYLFDTLADVLQQMIRQAYENGFLLHPLQQGAPIPALQYADDTLLILQGTVQQATCTKIILEAFAKFSGLKINFEKSTMVLLNMEQQVKNDIASILGCPISDLPCTYLGLPLSMNKIPRALLQPVLQKIEKRLPGWVPQMMSMAGRLALINSVLAAIPNFFMACIQWDKGSIEAINKTIRAFLWKNKDKVQGGNCLVSWDVVTMTKAQGGLGVRNLEIHNKAMMACLVTKVLSSANGPCFGWLATWYLDRHIPISAKVTDTPFLKLLVQLVPTVQASTSCIIGNGQCTSFWHDNWTSAGRLCQIFSVLYSFARDQLCSVQSQNHAGVWEINLHQPLSMRATQQYHNLNQLLHSDGINLSQAADRRTLVTTGKAPTTKDYYSLFSDHGHRWSPARWVWKNSIPHRRRVFLWLAFRGRLNTRDNTIKKTWTDHNGCDRCPATESVAHLALHCQNAQHIWTMLGMATEAAQSNDITCFVEQIQKRTKSESWPICFAACIWVLWKCRNDRVFNMRGTSNLRLRRNITEELELWGTRLSNDLGTETWVQLLSTS